MYISCYKPNETNFTHQGQFKVKVDEEENNIYRALNGQFYTTFKVPITDKFVENLIPRMIVKIPTPNKNNPMQLFRIVDYDEDDNGDIIFTAFHIAWDLSTGFLPHINIVGQTRKQAAEYILEKAKETQNHSFNIIDINDPKEQKNLQVVRYSPLVALMGNKDNTLLNRYENTEFDFDNFNIIISNRIGNDTGFLVKDNKNIITSNKNLDYKPIATRIIPQGADELLLPEYYIDSPRISDYDTIFYKHVTFNEIGINEEEDITKEKAIEMLREASMALFMQQNIDLPYLSWTISFDDMQDNENIPQQLRNLLKLDIGDSVIVNKYKLANKLNARILEYNYNFVKGKYKDITISNTSKNFTVSLEQSVADINFKVDNFTSIVSNINQTMLSKIEQTEKNILLEVNKNYASKSSIDILSNQISHKVDEGNFGTLVQQNAYAVKIAWNNISNYIQFENGGLSIYDGSVSQSKKRAVFNETGNHFWRDGYYLGKIGTNQYLNNSSIKGIVFDLEPDGGYMCWASKSTNSSSTYTIRLAYANKTIGNYTAGKLHAGADIDMHNYTLRNVNFEGGGITGTLNFTQIVGMNSNGTASRWFNNSKLVFQNGILINATWGNP